MPEDYVWYRRLAEVPAVNYISPSDIDRSKLREANAKPKIQTYRSLLDGQPHTSVMWGDTSQSPAAGHRVTYDGGRRLCTEAELREQLRFVYEAFELPGSAHDYHFRLMGACEVLWSNRELAPWALNEVERLSLLDIQLVEAHPYDRGEDMDMRDVGQPAYWRLMMMYQREGYLLEAAEVAERASRFVQRDPQNRQDTDPRQQWAQQASEIRVRIAAIEGRDGS